MHGSFFLVDANELSLEKRRTKLGLQHYLRLHTLPNSVAYNTICDESNEHLFLNENIRAPMGIRMKRIIQSQNLNPINILPCPIPISPPWRIQDISCDGLMTINKSRYSANQIKQIFLNHIHQCHSNSYHIYTDGSSTAEGSGSGIYSDFISRSVKLSTVASSFAAEMFAILEALQHLEEGPDESSVIFTDSRSSIQILDKILSNHPIVTQIHSILSRLITIGKQIKFCWVPSHVDILGNEEADRLARTAASAQTVIERPSVPHKDYYPLIRKNLLNEWQAEWTNTPESNKLRSFRDTIKPWPSSYQKVRKYEVILARLRIGHTRLTHGHLMRGEPLPPYCDNCVIPVTIKHILVECPDHNDVRSRMFGVNASLGSILSDQPNRSLDINKIITFLSTIGVLNEI